MAKRVLKKSSPQMVKVARGKSETDEMEDRAEEMTVAAAIRVLGSIPMQIIECTLTEQEKSHAVKSAKLALIEQSGNQALAEYISDELGAIYSFDWVCVVGQNLGAAMKPSTKPRIVFTLGESTIIVSKESAKKNGPFGCTTNIHYVNMNVDMKDDALRIAQVAMEKKDDLAMAHDIKQKFDEKYGKYWHCQVADQVLPALSFSPKLNHCITFDLGSKRIILFKAAEASPV